MAFVEGKSSIGRQGLIVATATMVAPGFHGVIVLELANAGTVPLILHPGMEIAQLVMIKLENFVPESEMYRGRFQCQVKP
jgi:dCTP deaminase